MIRVLIIQAQMKQYRVPFFARLHEALLQNGIELKVAYSEPPCSERSKQDNAELPPEIGIKVYGYWFLGGKLFYQGVMRQALAADLVIAEQANKYLHNFILLGLRLLRFKRMGLFGHGSNRMQCRSRVSELIRPWIARRAEWWFTYTEGTTDWLAANGVRRDKITCFQNSTDTRALASQIAAITDGQQMEARQGMRIERGSRIGIYCGSLIPSKGIPILLEAARLVRERIPTFHLLILGAGPERERVEQTARQAPWIHYMGPRFGEAKALLLKMSDCFLLPGYVGLAILDAFAAGLPLITTYLPYHSPEVEYLEEGMNGRMTDNNVGAYAESVVEVLSNQALLEHLKAGARESVGRYSIESMVENFRTGILNWLQAVGAGAAVEKSSSPCPDSGKGLPLK